MRYGWQTVFVMHLFTHEAYDQWNKGRRLAPILGGRSRVSQFFSGKRRLSVPQMQKIRDVLHIPADLLMDSPGPARKVSRRERREAQLHTGATRSRGRRQA